MTTPTETILREDSGTTAAAGRRRRQWERLAVEALGIGGFYLAVLVFFSVRVPDFFTTQDLQTILAGATVLGIVAIGQAFAVISGGFDLSVGGVVPLGAVLFGVFDAHAPLAVATLACVLVGGTAGVVNGVIVARLRINPLIATLATLSITGGVAYVIADGQTRTLTGAGAGLWGDNAVLGVQYGTVALLALILLGTWVLRYTVFGRSIYTIGGNREAALLAGLNVESISVAAFAISGACAGFAGVVAASQLLAASPTIGTDTTLNSVAAVVLGGASLAGGVGGVPGTVLGVLLLATTTVGLSLMQVASFYQTIVTGAVLLVAVLFGRLRDVVSARRALG